MPDDGHDEPEWTVPGLIPGFLLQPEAPGGSSGQVHCGETLRHQFC